MEHERRQGRGGGDMSEFNASSICSLGREGPGVVDHIREFELTEEGE
jgi:hypothetical protein